MKTIKELELKLQLAIWFIKWAMLSELLNAKNKQDYKDTTDLYNNILDKLK